MKTKISNTSDECANLSFRRKQESRFSCLAFLVSRLGRNKFLDSRLRGNDAIGCLQLNRRVFLLPLKCYRMSASDQKPPYVSIITLIVSPPRTHISDGWSKGGIHSLRDGFSRKEGFFTLPSRKWRIISSFWRLFFLGYKVLCQSYTLFVPFAYG